MKTRITNPRKSLNQAVFWKNLPSAPMKGSRAPSMTEKYEFQPWSAEQVNKFLLEAKKGNPNRYIRD
ncbi:hypothetical protein ACXFAU_04800 [Paenibacillus glucanolyticus]